MNNLSEPRIRIKDRNYEKASLTLALTLAAMSIFGPFSMDTVFPAFKAMGTQFGVDNAAMQSLISVYLLAFAVASIFHGPLSDAIGRKPVVVAGALLYALASVAAAFSPSLPIMLIFRACQGATAGAGMIIGRAVIRDLFVGAEAQRQMGMVSMIFSVAPAIAPIIGGLLLLAGPWNLIFWFLGLWGALVAILVALTLPESHPIAARQPLKVRTLVKGLFHVARNIRFQGIAFAMIFTFAGQFLYISSAPVLVRDLLGLGEQDFWVFFIPLILGILGGSLIQQRYAARISGRTLVKTGLAIALTTGALNVLLALLPATSGRLPWVVFAPMGISFGAQVAFPILSIAMLDMFPAHRGSAASVQSFEQLLFNAALAGIISPLATTSILNLALWSLGFMVVGTVALFLIDLRFRGQSLTTQ
ncbi:MAG: multidrug effflux MFS transporter [Propionibacteriaceae bacterium]